MNIKVIIVSLSKGVFTKLQNMFIIFSILFFSSIFTTNISGFKDPNLPEDFFSKWENSQVFIYYRMGFLQKFQSEYPYPDCFGNLLTAEYVLTATTCFMHMDTLVEISKWVIKKVRSNADFVMSSIFKTDIDKMLVAKVGIMCLKLKPYPVINILRITRMSPQIITKFLEEIQILLTFL